MPVHSAVPTASSSHGWLTGRVSNNARPLPAHSNVTGTVTAGRARRSSRESVERAVEAVERERVRRRSTNGTS